MPRDARARSARPVSPGRDHVAGIAGGAVFFTITAIAQPFFALYASSLGASTAMIGLLVTLRALVPMFIAMPVGQLIDAVGPLKMARLGAALLVAALALTAVGNLFVLGLSQTILGASIIITASSLQVLVSRGEEGVRNRHINHYSMAMSGGGMVGPLLGGGLISLGGGATVAGYRFAFVVAALVSLVAAVVLQVGFRGATAAGPGERPREALSLRRMVGSYTSAAELARIRGVQFGLAGTFLIMFMQSLSFSFIPLYLASMGYGTALISVMVSLNGLAGIVSRAFLDPIIRRTGLERLLVLAGCAAAACLAVLPFASVQPLVLAALTALMGGAGGMNLPVSIMIMVNATAEHERGKVMGLRLLANRVSQMIGPALFGVLGQAMGLSGAFHIGGGALFASILAFGLTHARRPVHSRGAEG